MKAIADTGLLVGFLDGSDQYHRWAVDCFAQLHSAIISCEAVIAETEYLVPGSGPLLMEMVQRGALQIRTILPDEAGPVGSVLKRYRKMQFADACVVRLSELLPKATVYTTDKRGFSIYRRHRNQPVKLVTP